jgi:DNA polymerase elongation subunit (family B)
MIGRVTWTDYTEHESLGVLVRLSARLKNGRKFNGYVQGTEPYIFVPENESVPNYSYVDYVEKGYESLFDEPLQKVVTKTPKQAGGLTDEFSWSGEGDVPYYRRVAIHDGLSGYIELPDTEETYRDKPLVHIDDINVDPDFDEVIEPRIGISDIEVHVGEDSFDEMKHNGTEAINVICTYDTHAEDYSVFYYDKYDNLDPSNIRPKLEEQMDGTSLEGNGESSVDLFSADSEIEMLNSFVDFVNERGFDIISGWNFTDFDYRYIRNRMKTLHSEGENVHYSWLSPFNTSSSSRNSQMKICGLPSFDMMEAFCDKMTFHKWRSQSLEYVSNEELGVGKIGDVDINENWKNDPSKLIAYNIVDVILTVALDKANDIHNFFYELADVSSIPVYDTFYEKRLVDGYVMSRRSNKEVLPTANETEEIGNAGGYVADPVDGRFRKVGVADLKSLYPSAMITWNISTETVAPTPDEFDEYVKIPHVPEPKNVEGKIKEDQIDWDWLYASLDKEGIIPRTLKKLFKKRNREKSRMYEAEEGSAEEAKWNRKQGSTKVIMNSFYGNSSSPYWRLANKYLGDAVTSTARYTLWTGRQSVEDAGYDAIYGDTDSHFIQLKSSSIEEQVEELEEISAKMDEDASDIFKDIHPKYEDGMKHPFLIDSDLHGDEKTCMMWEPEKIYEVWMQLGKKKRYAGNLGWKEGEFYSEPKISITGFENQRSDSMEITAELQKNVIRMILTDADFAEVSDYIQSKISGIDEYSDDVKKFALPKTVNKDTIYDYDNSIIRRSVVYSNEELGYEFLEGDDPFVYYVEKTPPGLPETDVVAFEWHEEIPEGFSLDEEAIIERGIKKPIDTIIKEVGWEFEELRSGREMQEMDFGTGDPFE